MRQVGFASWRESNEKSKGHPATVASELPRQLRGLPSDRLIILARFLPSRKIVRGRAFIGLRKELGKFLVYLPQVFHRCARGFA
jgi:hypothetical protein